MKGRSLWAALFDLVVGVAGVGCICFALYYSSKGDYARTTWNLVLGLYGVNRKGAK